MTAWLSPIERELRVCAMRHAAAGIGEYEDCDHQIAVDYARRWREQPSNIARQLGRAA